MVLVASPIHIVTVQSKLLSHATRHGTRVTFIAHFKCFLFLRISFFLAPVPVVAARYHFSCIIPFFKRIFIYFRCSTLCAFSAFFSLIFRSFFSFPHFSHYSLLCISVKSHTPVFSMRKYSSCTRIVCTVYTSASLRRTMFDCSVIVIHMKATKKIIYQLFDIQSLLVFCVRALGNAKQYS